MLGATAVALTAARLGLLSMPASAASPAPLNSVKGGVLEVSYAETGPATGEAMLLLHGWPYDIHAFDEVAPILAARGYRVIVPYLRGFGSTRFLSPDTLRNGQPGALATDAGAERILERIRSVFGATASYRYAEVYAQTGNANRAFAELDNAVRAKARDCSS